MLFAHRNGYRHSGDEGVPNEGLLNLLKHLRSTIQREHREGPQSCQGDDKILQPLASNAKALGVHDANLFRHGLAASDGEAVRHVCQS